MRPWVTAPAQEGSGEGRRERGGGQREGRREGYEKGRENPAKTCVMSVH